MRFAKKGKRELTMATPLNGSILKGFAILRLFTPERTELSAVDVASDLGMTNATAHRFLMSLEEAGALISYRRGHFTLSRDIEEMGRLAELTNPLAERIQPVLNRLARGLNESVMACHLGRNGPRCIAVAGSDRPISVNVNVGTVLPIAETAQGKIFLAEMSEPERADWLKKRQTPTDLASIRQNGFACNYGENEPDIGAVSVPLRDKSGQLILTISTFGILSRFKPEFIKSAVEILKSEAARFRL